VNRPPLIVVEGSVSAFAAARADITAGGWTVVESWAAARRGVVCAAVVDGEGSARSVVLAALAGAGVLVHGVAPRDVLDRLCDDLRRLGPLDHRIAEPDATPTLEPDDRALLELLLGGASLGDAAHTLHISRRTADRRLARARLALGAATTTEAVVLARRLSRQGAPMGSTASAK
jgi:DNA-binding CsgD family transcriptional regulator